MDPLHTYRLQLSLNCSLSLAAIVNAAKDHSGRFPSLLMGSDLARNL